MVYIVHCTCIHAACCRISSLSKPYPIQIRRFVVVFWFLLHFPQNTFHRRFSLEATRYFIHIPLTLTHTHAVRTVWSKPCAECVLCEISMIRLKVRGTREYESERSSSSNNNNRQPNVQLIDKMLIETSQKLEARVTPTNTLCQARSLHK